MSATCYWCYTGHDCDEHRDLLHSASPSLPLPPAPKELPQPFHVLIPSQPRTLTKPFDQCSSSERAKIVATNPTPNASSGGTKRKSGDTAFSTSSESKRPCAPSTQPVAKPETSKPKESRPLVSSAWDVHMCIQGCSTRTPPKDTDLNSIQDSDAAYQRSKSPQEFRRPMGEFLRCIYCLRNSGKWTTWTNQSGGVTGRIREHMQKKHSEEFLPRVQPAHISLHAGIDYSGLEYLSETFAKSLAQWIAVDDQAMNVVECPEFRKLLVLASRAPNLQDTDIPHQTKTTKTINELYMEEKSRIKHDLEVYTYQFDILFNVYSLPNLQNACGRVSITSDLWGDPNLRSYMAVTAHYINHEGYLAEHLIAFRRVRGHHSGENLGRILFAILNEFGLTNKKLGHITLDNASNNNTLMEELEIVFKQQGLFTFGRTLNRIRCFPHVINLSVTTLLKQLPEAARWFRRKAATDGDALDDDILDYLDALESELVKSVRDSVKEMRKTDLRRDGFTESIKLGNFHGLFKDEAGETVILPVVQLKRDSETRWSSTLNMIKQYLELYPAVIRYSAENPEMKILVISQRQFDVLQDLVLILEVLDSAQELLSAERTPTLALALPVYENLIQVLYDRAIEFPMLQYAIDCGIKKLDAYVATTRNTPAYAIAMAINPCIKFRWIDEHWDRVQLSKKPKISLAPTTASLSNIHSSTAKNSTSPGLISDLNPSVLESRTLSSSPPQPTLSAGDLLTRHMIEVDSELLRWEAFDQYDGMSMGTVNLVEFWKAQRYAFPLLYQVAMGVLPIQASSVSSERAFSSSKMTCTRERSKISVDNMEHLQVLKHSLHRRRSDDQDNYQTLDFMAHVVNPNSEEEIDGDTDD
ncbi:hAT family dimerization protein [Ceratobasidium sp. AG-Ba]|nr:hAT family dimerization protein [Ceratobasidium sp. AG-Ba]